MVCKTSQAVIDYLNTKYNKNIQLADIKTYYMERWIDEECRHEFPQIFLNKQVWKSIQLIDECQSFINQLHSDGHEIYWVTSTEIANCHKKSRWLERNFPYISCWDYFIRLKNKQLLSGLDILIDDYEKNLIGGKYHKIMLDYPYNQNVDCDKHGIVRCHNWQEIFNEIKRYEHERGDYVD